MSDVAILTPKSKVGRHSWGEPVRYQFKTERCCLLCGTVKVTRHEPDRHPWLEFWRGLERIKCESTPPCTGKIENML